MARLEPGEPLTTKEPVLTIDAGLRPGRYTFELVVVTRDGRESKGARATVVVRERQ